MLVKTLLVNIGISGTWADVRFRFVDWIFRKWKWLRGA